MTGHSPRAWYVFETGDGEQLPFVVFDERFISPTWARGRLVLVDVPSSTA